MDIVGYKSTWNDAEGEIPKKRINVASHIWDLSVGEFFSDDFKYRDAICRKVKNIAIVDEELANSKFAVQPAGDITGHMMVVDNTTTRAAGIAGQYPIMPNYVRDLAGRVICIAECYPLQKESAKSKRFPNAAFCMEGKEGEDLIENVFMSQFRTLDMSSQPFIGESGKPGVENLFTYPNANLHPYKLRVDTFYQDGWKLPQTEMLYFKRSVDAAITDDAVADFLKKWEDTDLREDYEAFYEECGGEEYFEDLFTKGVTLVPTLEAYNANPIVDREFNLVDFNSGKYVGEFHELAEYVDSDQPAGSIIKVLRPGFLTYNHLQKARVVVSNGSLYASPNAADPDPVYPDLRLPHSRTSSKWGAVHVPTHPKHFETSAIWGWDFKTGAFLQKRGPIWDPLHYFYKSVDIIKYYYQDDVMEENLWFYRVPEKIKQKFFPVVPFAGYDILDSFEKEDRVDYVARPFTMCKRHNEDIFSTNVGYHPMPVEFEYEIDPWVLPGLSPKTRVLTEIPLNIRDKMVNVVQSSVSAKIYLSNQVENSQGNPYWINDGVNMENSKGDPLKDYPYLSRYLEHLTSHSRMDDMVNLFLEEAFYVDLRQQLSEFVAEIKLPTSVDHHLRDMTVAYYELKEKSFTRLRNRHNLYQNQPIDYLTSYWNCEDVDNLDFMVDDHSMAKLEESKFSSVAIMQPPTF